MKHVRLVAVLFGVSKQRAHQLAGKDGFPAPVAEYGRGRGIVGTFWKWAKGWRNAKPWR